MKIYVLVVQNFDSDKRNVRAFEKREEADLALSLVKEVLDYDSYRVSLEEVELHPPHLSLRGV